ncbi:hypothetical protein C2S53_003297 [Perilla frutescens var. hirtella]|uniref:C2H2-type domain-containing protein n=1 Tax=Perilla frutescens var. hirtella TaxID=608512 RepID=A0AAD4P751_PERFH|nr:hypothetical protein C2S53_003297 [Perilla frutescens var. hirtella]
MADMHHQDDSDDQEKKEIDLGVGRSYECVFCKRGFNTAQALGGHMNIHRKDRARNRPSSNSTKQNPRFYHNIIPSSNNIPPFTSYFPAVASTSSNSTLYESSSHCHHDADDDSDHRHHPQPPSNIPVTPADWRRMSLSLEIQDLEKNTLQAINQDKELDLELRLGYH